jgi:dethiobiotin synthetase
MSRGYFIAGTDTGVGKTQVAAALISLLGQRHKRVVGMKPVASGCIDTGDGLRNDDAQRLIEASSIDVDYEDVNPYAFAPAIAPHLAAEDVGIKIELQSVLDHFECLQQQADCVVVEGVGGWMVPLGHIITTEHMAKALGLPVVLVVGMRLGCLNHALLSARAIEASGLRLAGWVANTIDPEMERVNDNLHTLKKRLNVPFLGLIPRVESAARDEILQFLSLPE